MIVALLSTSKLIQGIVNFDKKIVPLVAGIQNPEQVLAVCLFLQVLSRPV
jgi:hypothetical protein